MLSKIQFDILSTLVETKKPLSQRELSRILNYSLGSINKAFNQLTDSNFIVDNQITSDGLIALEPYKVKRAIIIAAGFGSRMIPITLNTPKPLVRVHGIRIIDRLLDALVKNDIQEIIIVRGYLAEQFDQLKYKYPTIKFIDNHDFNSANNISSAVYAKDYFENAYVCEADLVVNNDCIIKKYHYSSNVLGIYKERTDDWCFITKNKIIQSQQVGGVDCYQEVGIHYLDALDGKKLADTIEDYYKLPGGKERFWDQALYSNKNVNFSIEVRECEENDIVEIDTFNELKKIDSSYNI